MNYLNNRSYRNVENLKNFNKNNIKKYYRNKLKSSDKHIDFIRKKIIKNNWKVNICEIGSGNGKLLYRLEKENMIFNGIGFEISKSRCKFSEKFKKFVNSKKIKIENKNFLNSKLKNGSFDLMIGVDIVFNLIAANSKKEAKKVLSLSKKYLKKGGTIVLEVSPFNKELSLLQDKKNYKKIVKFAPSDPYRNCIQKYKKIKKNLYIHKKFTDKNGNSSSFSNLVLPIKKSYWKKLKDWNVKIYDYWNKKNDTDENEYIVVLKKK